MMVDATEGLGSPKARKQSSGSMEGESWSGKLVGAFRLGEQIGAGAQGSVYHGVHSQTGQRCAVKLMHFEAQAGSSVGGAHPILIERFRREAKTIAKLQHPNIVKLIDFGQLREGGFYMAMELLVGKSLQQCLDDGEQFSIAALLSLSHQLFDALQHTHESGVFHRDLKPDNIFLVRNGEEDVVKIIDFGIAAIKEVDVQLTKSNAFIGTPQYMSPEQAQGKLKEYDARSELYTAGLILYILLTGRLPFVGQTFLDLAYQHACAEPPSLAEMVEGKSWSSSLEAFFASVLAKDPLERPADTASCWRMCEAALLSQQRLESTRNASTAAYEVDWSETVKADAVSLVESDATAAMPAPDFSAYQQSSGLSNDEAATEVMLVGSYGGTSSEANKTPTLLIVVVLVVLAAISLLVWVFALRGSG